MKRRLLEALSRVFTGVGRNELYAKICCGEVTVDDAVIKDPKALVSDDSRFEFKKKTYVSRGGLKLERALLDHAIEPAGRVVLDAGASTGGFTDCLLSHGAAFVHAVDVGYNQLDYSLRRRSEVEVHERTNIMDITALDPVPDFAVADLSFRSLRGAASHILELVREDILLALVKPQFEWENPPGSFEGVVRNVTDIRAILTDLAQDLSREGTRITGVSESPITGREGNREFFFRLSRGKGLKVDTAIDRIDELLREASQ